MLEIRHLENGDNLRTVRQDRQPSARAALRLIQQVEFDEAYWLAMAAMALRDDEPTKTR